MRILHMIALGGRGGTGYTAFRLVRLLHEHKQNVKMALWPGTVLHELALKHGVPHTTELKMQPKFHPVSFVKDVFRLKKMIEDDGIQIVHTYRSPDYWRAAIAVLLCKNKPKLVRSRSIVVPVKQHLFNRWIHNHVTDCVLATAKLIYQNYENARKFDCSKVRLFLDGVDAHKYSPDNKNDFLREKYNLSEDTLIAGMVARFSKIKGYRYLLPSIKKLQQQNIHFFLVGFGPMKEEIESWVAENKLDNVTVIGEKVQDIDRYFGAFDLYLLTSIGSEGSSRATLEAMASGLPIVATKVGVLPDLIEEKVNGLLIKDRSEDEIIEAMTWCVNHRDELKTMGGQAREFIENNFSEERVIENLIAIYQELLGQ